MGLETWAWPACVLGCEYVDLFVRSGTQTEGILILEISDKEVLPLLRVVVAGRAQCFTPRQLVSNSCDLASRIEKMRSTQKLKGVSWLGQSPLQVH